jgi:hypothetical protein
METKPSLRYAWYVVGVLLLAYISSFIDRQILSLLVKPIKASFGMKNGGSASSRADGIASRGKTNCKMY